MAKLKRWEYCSLWFFPTISQYKLELKTLEPFSDPRPAIYEDGVGPEMAIARLGMEGWEMVTFHFLYQPDNPTEVYFFKRRILDES